MKKNDESQFKVQQTKLKTNAEKITVGCSQGEQSNNENKKCQAKKSQERYIRSKKPLQNRQPQKSPVHMQSVTKKIDKQSKEPAITYKKRNQVSMEEDQKSQVPIGINKNCQYRCVKSPRRPVCEGKKCPSTLQKYILMTRNVKKT